MAAHGFDVVARRGPADQQGLHLHHERDRDQGEHDPDRHRPPGVPPRVVGEDRRRHPAEGEDRADERAHVLDQQHGQRRPPRPTHERPVAGGAAGIVGLADGGAQRQGVEDQGAAEDPSRDRRVDQRLGGVEAVPAPQHGEGRSGDEGRDGDDERPELAAPALAVPAGHQQPVVAAVDRRVDAAGEQPRRAGDHRSRHLRGGGHHADDEADHRGTGATLGGLLVGLPSVSGSRSHRAMVRARGRSLTAVDLRDARYVSFTTYRRDGTPVATPVWIAPFPTVGRASPPTPMRARRSGCGTTPRRRSSSATSVVASPPARRASPPPSSW